MTRTTVESLLEQMIGLSVEAVGSDMVTRAVALRLERCGLTDKDAYLKLLAASQKERAELIEAVVVPETWFFRNGNSFAFLVNYVREEWFPKHAGVRLRVLSLPCSTGEEPYSIAMALLDGGVAEDRFRIDGVDISNSAIARAESALYGEGSFRGDEISFRDRYFEREGDCYRLKPDIVNLVRFARGNLLNESFVVGRKPYDVIFCRNLLIYLSPDAKRRSLQALDRLLAPSGILFLGHAERQAAVEWGFYPIPAMSAFACGRGPRKDGGITRPLFHEMAGEGAAPHSPLPETPRRETAEEDPGAGSPREGNRDLFVEAQSLADQGVLDRALERCEACLRNNPAHVEGHFLMGLICEALDMGEQAEAAFNRAIYLDPGHYEALVHLSFIFEHRGDRERATLLRRRARLVREKGWR